jgi:hypothetical protein
MTTETPVLKPCPFGCKIDSLLEVYQLPDSPSRRIYCLGCDGSGPWGDTYEEAVRLWNTRADPENVLPAPYGPPQP